MKTEKYKSCKYFHFEDVFVEIVIANNYSFKEAKRIAKAETKAILKNDFIYLIFDNRYSIVKSNDRKLYEFEVCTKKLPPPINIKEMTWNQNKELILHDEYMCKPDDYLIVSWSITEAYEKLKSLYPHMTHFDLSSLRYRIEKENSL
ncbi:hypothetical protein JOD82_002243 [Paenibacillus sp. 1182]|uniref:hypothetical protein n=1 Tax=Paenibacillus sp. 1182 TaxID=2806565 RepID=UPI001AE548BA|nr:hypothetical protein [Paenibacillus sp. 1182]MBP1309223.1 hypothetical protein [Paenibacillus sp. 1182]